MVLSALGNFIHHFYLLLYYTFRITTIIGSLLYDTIVKVTHSVYWCAQNVTVFFRIVYEDNHNLIRDANAIITGTSVFFINNVGKVCSAVYSLCTLFRDAIVACWSFTCLTVLSVKRALILTGEAVWMLFTAPFQLLFLLNELLDSGTQQLLQAARNAVTICSNALTDFAYYAIHDVPVKAVLGLMLLGLIYLNPAPARSILRFLARVALFTQSFLRQKAAQILISLFRKVRYAGRAGCIGIRVLLGHFLRLTFIGSLYLWWNRLSRMNPSIPLSWSMFELSNYRTRRNQRNTDEATPAREQEPPEAISPPTRRSPPRAKIGPCIICEDDDRTIAFVPCGHLCVCKTCAQNISYYNPVCPVCRTRIEKQLKVYL